MDLALAYIGLICFILYVNGNPRQLLAHPLD